MNRHSQDRLKGYADLSTEQQCIAQVVRCYLHKFNRKISVWKYLWRIEVKQGVYSRLTYGIHMKINRTTYRYTVELVNGIHETYYRVYGIDNKKTWSTIHISEVFNENDSV